MVTAAAFTGASSSHGYCFSNERPERAQGEIFDLPRCSYGSFSISWYPPIEIGLVHDFGLFAVMRMRVASAL